MTPDEEQEEFERARDHVRRSLPWSLACLLVEVVVWAVILAAGVHRIQVSRWGWVLLAGIYVTNLLVNRFLGGGSQPRWLR
jgi:hypothetical protein